MRNPDVGLARDWPGWPRATRVGPAAIRLCLLRVCCLLACVVCCVVVVACVLWSRVFGDYKRFRAFGGFVQRSGCGYTSEAEKLVDGDQIQRERGACPERRVLADEELPGALCRELAACVLLFEVDGDITRACCVSSCHCSFDLRFCLPESLAALTFHRLRTTGVPFVRNIADRTAVERIIVGARAVGRVGFRLGWSTDRRVGCQRVWRNVSSSSWAAVAP